MCGQSFLNGKKKKLSGSETDAMAPEAKRCRLNETLDSKASALTDEKGEEVKVKKEFLGRCDVPLHLLDISSKVCTPVVREVVDGLKEAIKNRFEPSLIKFTVAPKDPEKFNWDFANMAEYWVLSGRHLLTALKELDGDGVLENLKTLQKKSVTCFILKSSSALVMNYANIRLKDIESFYTNKPEIQSLLTVYQGLAKEVSTKESLDAVYRYASTLGFTTKDKEALKRLLQWPQRDFDELVNILNKYQLFQLADSRTTSKSVMSKLKLGSFFPLRKTFFHQISKIPPDFFQKNVNDLIEKKITLKSVAERAEVHVKRSKTYNEVVKLSGYSKDLLEKNSESFSGEKLDSFEGAVTGEDQNGKGEALSKYCKEVFKGKTEKPKILFCELKSASESFDIIKESNLVVFNLTGVDETCLRFIEKVFHHKKKNILVLVNSRNDRIEVMDFMSQEENYEIFHPKELYIETMGRVSGHLNMNIILEFLQEMTFISRL